MSTTEELVSADGLKLAAGVRRVTPAGLAAHRAARTYAANRTLAAKRIDALQLAKRAAAALGLKAAKIAMIDKLFGFSPASDWTSKDSSPIVWPSNGTLARQLGLSISTARHHLRGLAAAGLIAHASHPTYHRRGVRDEQGNIVEAFGIDLSPIIVRYDELLQIALTYEREGLERRALSYQRTRIRREIEAVLVAARREGLVGDWQHFHARLDKLRIGVPSELVQFRELIEALTALREDVEVAYQRASESANLDTAVASFRQVQTTADLQPIEDSRTLPSAAPGILTTDAPPTFTLPAFRKSRENAHPTAPTDGMPALRPVEDIGNVSLGLVRAACPALQKYDPDVSDSWTALRSSARRLCAAAAINTQVWTEAEINLGPDAAITALAVTIQRADDGHVSNPGAYLRSLVQRGKNGQLRISRSLFALAGAEYANVTNQNLRHTPPYHGFPLDRISWCVWADLVREHSPKPIPDVDLVADAFRSWCRKGNIDLAQPSIQKAFIGFCKKWRQR
jgi:replication initiation protein RepC